MENRLPEDTTGDDPHLADPQRLARERTSQLQGLAGIFGTSATIKERESVCADCGKPFTARVLPLFGASDLCYECRDRLDREAKARAQQELEAGRASIRESMRATCGLPFRQRSWTFDTWEGKTQAFRACLKYAEDFPLDNRPALREWPSLYIYSRKNGVGKSHLASAICNRLIDRWSGDPSRVPLVPARYTTSYGLLTRVRGTYNRRNPEEFAETEEDVYRWASAPPLLVVDDISKESMADPGGRPPSEHTRRVYFQVIDQRYASGKPLVIVGNVELTEFEALFGSASASRLAEMTRVGMVEVKGEDRRWKK